MKYYLFSDQNIFSSVFHGNLRFCYVDLHRAKFENILLCNFVFIGTYLRGAYFINCQIKKCYFGGANMIDLWSEGTKFEKCIFYHNIIMYARFSKCSFEDSVEFKNFVLDADGFFEYWSS